MIIKKYTYSEYEHYYIKNLKDINSLIHSLTIKDCHFYLRLLSYYPEIMIKYKKGILKQIYRFIHLQPDIIEFSKIVLEKNKYEYNEFIWKCLKKSTRIVSYIDLDNKLLNKIFNLSEHKINEFVYNYILHNYLCPDVILKNINKCPRLIYLCPLKKLRNIHYIKQVLYKTKYSNNCDIIINYLIDNHINCIYNYEIIELIVSINCNYLNKYIQDLEYNIHNYELIKRLLYRCSCCLQYYDINYNNLNLIYQFIKINIDSLNFININKIKNKEDFLYNCCNINMNSIVYFLKQFNYAMDLQKYYSLVDINPDVIFYIEKLEDSYLKNKLVIYFFRNKYYKNYNRLDNYFINIKNFYIASYKTKLPIEIKKNIYSYLYSI